MLQVFSASWCSACKVVKQFLNKNNVKFIERDIEVDKEAYDLLMRLQLHSIPVVYLDDNNFVIGTDQKKIIELASKINIKE